MINDITKHRLFIVPWQSISLICCCCENKCEIDWNTRLRRCPEKMFSLGGPTKKNTSV